MTDLIERLRALLATATPGEWKYAMFDDGMCIFQEDSAEPRVESRVLKIFRWAGDSPEREANMKLVPAMRNALPTLLDALEAKERELVELRAKVEKHSNLRIMWRGEYRELQEHLSRCVVRMDAETKEKP